MSRAAGVARVGEVLRVRRRQVVLLVGALVLGPVVANLVFAYDAPAGVYLNGFVVGALNALVAMGLILVYRANRIINFAQATLGVTPVVLALLLIDIHHWPWAAGLAVVVVTAPLLGAGVEMATVRMFHKSPRLMLTMATIGIAQALAVSQVILPVVLAAKDGSVRSSAAALAGTARLQGQISTPLGQWRAEIGGVVFSANHLFALLVVAGLAVGLAAFFRYTDVGVAVRAAAENGDRALLVGIPVRKLSTVVWAIAGVLSGVGIFLRAPITGMPVGGELLGPGIMLYALTAAVIARMESLPVAFTAAVGLGMLDQVAFFGTRDATLSNALILPVILVALFVQRHSLARARELGASTWTTVKEFHGIPAHLRDLPIVRRARLACWAAGGAFLVFLPFVVGRLKYATAALLLVYALVGISLVILTGWAGQISLGQWALSGVGAAVAGTMATRLHADFFVTIFAAGVAGALFSLIVGIPALRVRGLFLAVTTLAFAANMQYFFLDRRYMGRVLPEPDAAVLRPFLYGATDVRGDLAFYYVCLAFLGIGLAVARSIRSSRSGRILIATRDNPNAAQAFGIDLMRSRLAAFAIAGFLAAVAGALFAYLNGAVDAPAFSPTASTDLLTMTIIGGLTSPIGAILGAVYLVTFRYFVPNEYSLYLVAQGLGVVLALRFAPGGLVEVGYRLRDRLLKLVETRTGAVGDGVPAGAGQPAGGPDEGDADVDRVLVVAGASHAL